MFLHHKPSDHLSFQVLRRVIVFYLLWMAVGFGTFVYTMYYPILLEEPLLQLEYDALTFPTYKW